METPRTLKAQAINVDIPADSRFLVALRVLARTAGALVDLSIDRIEDMQLAVDEAATLLVGLAGADSTSPLTAEFLLMPSELSARLSVSCPAGSTLDEDSLGWLVLTGLGFPVSVLQEDGRACIQVTSNPS